MDTESLARILSLLQAIEFRGPWDHDTCPFCGYPQSHREDCELAAVIRVLQEATQ